MGGWVVAEIPWFAQNGFLRKKKKLLRRAGTLFYAIVTHAQKPVLILYQIFLTYTDHIPSLMTCILFFLALVVFLYIPEL